MTFKNTNTNSPPLTVTQGQANDSINQTSTSDPFYFKPMRKSARAGLIFPVHRIHRSLKQNNHSYQVRDGTAVYMGAVLEYLVAELTELAGNVARDNKRHRITPRHIFLAIHNDEELDKLCENVTIASGGVVPHLHQSLLQSKKMTKVNSSKAKGKKLNVKKQDNKNTIDSSIQSIDNEDAMDE